jgi:hypothetical protein
MRMHHRKRCLRSLRLCQVQAHRAWRRAQALALEVAA